MTIDERLERIAERHETLVQGLELFQHDAGEKIRALATIAEQNEARAAEMMDAITSQQARIETTAYRSFEGIRDSLQRLERIAIAHERRLDKLQG